MSTLLARISEMDQYDPATRSIHWRSSVNGKIQDVYTQLQAGDTAMFIGDQRIYIAEYLERTSEITRFGNVQSLDIRNDDLLRIDPLLPERHSRIKATFQPFISPIQLNIDAILDSVNKREFINFYATARGNIQSLRPKLSGHDRVVVLEGLVFRELLIFEADELKHSAWDHGLFMAKDKSIDEAVSIFQNTKPRPRTQNIRTLQRIKEAISRGEAYQFRSFAEYYNVIHNKTHYGKNAGSLEEHLEPDESNEEPNQSLNQILYGPPGTGKTYCTVDKAIEIVDGYASHSRPANKARFSALQGDNRIFFTTFHQNMSYEDFVEGIKPCPPEEDDEFIRYVIEDGLFMRACVEATYAYIQSLGQDETQEIANKLSFNAAYDQLYNDISKAPTGTLELKTKSGGAVNVTTTQQGNFSVSHPDKTNIYTVSRKRLSDLFQAHPQPEKMGNIDKDITNAIGGANSTAFWSVLKEVTKRMRRSENRQNEKTTYRPTYKEKQDIVKRYWAKKEMQIKEASTADNFVFIIDEINRGNIAQIFGELITLIEDDKRMGRPESLYVELPYSKRSFAVPPNLHIIGTMNTADRSVEALDTALRRRFSFVPMMPEYEGLTPSDEGIDLARLLDTLNKRLTVLKDADHTIGHAWLWNVQTLDDLKAAFGGKILPLLQEYFFNDYEKLGLVLGDRFFLTKEAPGKSVFAKFRSDSDLAEQFGERCIYTLKSAADLEMEDFKSLYE